MSKELKLYHVYDDGDGHRYLIPKDEVNTFYNILDNLEESLDEHGDEDIYYDELNMTLEAYGRLEGEDYYVVLAKGLGESVNE